MSRTILDVIESAINRRTFLNRMVRATGAVVAGILVGPKAALACEGCCGLCYPAGTCLSGYTWSDGVCTWKWECPYLPECRIYQCQERLIKLQPDCEAGCPSTDWDCAKCKINDEIYAICSVSIPGPTFGGCTPK